MTEFQPGFYQHFKGGIYLAHGLGEYTPIVPTDTLFTVAKHCDSLLGVGVYKNEHGGNFVLNGNGSTGLLQVVYQALYGEGNFWVRELGDFNGNKTLDSGEEVERFRFLGTEFPSKFLG